MPTGRDVAVSEVETRRVRRRSLAGVDSGCPQQPASPAPTAAPTLSIPVRTHAGGSTVAPDRPSGVGPPVPDRQVSMKRLRCEPYAGHTRPWLTSAPTTRRGVVGPVTRSTCLAPATVHREHCVQGAPTRAATSVRSLPMAGNRRLPCSPPLALSAGRCGPGCWNDIHQPCRSSATTVLLGEECRAHAPSRSHIRLTECGCVPLPFPAYPQGRTVEARRGGRPC